MNESNARLCKVCRQLKERIQDGQYNGKDKRWRDEAGGLWMGSTCPSCNRERIKNKMKDKRSAKIN